MLWRMIPIFEPADHYSHVLCRDADAITTYREACAVTEWLASGKAVHALRDDPMHMIPLMGGDERVRLSEAARGHRIQLLARDDHDVWRSFPAVQR